MKVYHRLNTDKVKKEINEEYSLLQLVVENGGKAFYLESLFAKSMKFYLNELKEYSQQNSCSSKLLLNNYIREKDFLTFQKNIELPFGKILRQEILFFEKHIHKKWGSEPSFVDFNEEFRDIYNLYTHDITGYLDDQIKIHYLEGVRNVFIKSTDNEGDKDMFNFSNFLLHFVNWEFSFYDFYETTRDILYGPLKKIESRFSYELNISLKAYLSFRSKSNALLRYIENKEHGKFTITFIDWEMEVKQVLINEFEKIFGIQKSKDYVYALDRLLSESLEKG